MICKFNIVILIFIVFLSACQDEKRKEVVILIENHHFKPEEIILRPHEKVYLIVKNLDATAEEFESFELKRERLIPAHSEARVPIGPLVPGIYKFFGEFHEKTAKGQIRVE